jgi:hypothetical protein
MSCILLRVFVGEYSDGFCKFHESRRTEGLNFSYGCKGNYVYACTMKAYGIL